MGFIVFAIFIILFDQASKFYIQRSMHIGESIPVIEGIFHITYIENPRTSFGLFEYNSSFFVIAVLISVILAILIYKKIIFKKNPFIYIPLTLILGGAVGNLIDRLRIDGRVIDFIEFCRFSDSMRNVSIIDSCFVPCPGKGRRGREYKEY